MDSVVVYGRDTGCKFCDIAKKNLHNRGVKFKFVDVSKDDNFKEFFKSIHTTVPQIYLNGVHRGGSEASLVVGKTQIFEEEVDDEFEW